MEACELTGMSWRCGWSTPVAAGWRSRVAVVCGSHFTGGVDGGLAGSGHVAVRRREQAAVLVAGHGKVTAEFFHSGESRTLPCARRPQAAALVAALADPGRGGTRW